MTDAEIEAERLKKFGRKVGLSAGISNRLEVILDWSSKKAGGTGKLGAFIAGGVAATGTAFVGIRQFFASAPGEFHVMNEHPDSDFYAGRAQNNTISMLIAAGMVAAGGYAYKSAMYESGDFVAPDTSEWGRASKFGVADKYMWGGMAEEFEESMTPTQQSIVEHGTYIHEQLQSTIEDYIPGAMSEYVIMDSKVKLTGHVDMVVPINMGDGVTRMTPLEVKTTSSRTLSQMTAPKEEHIAQAQFYLHHLAKENPEAAPNFEVFAYVARDKPGMVKTFTVQRDEKLFRKYLSRYRGYQSSMKNQGYTPQRLTSNVTIMGEVAAQHQQRRDLRATGPVTPGQLKEIIQAAASSYTPIAFGGHETQRKILPFKPQQKSNLGQQSKYGIIRGNHSDRHVNSSRAGVA